MAPSAPPSFDASLSTPVTICLAIFSLVAQTFAFGANSGLFAAAVGTLVKRSKVSLPRTTLMLLLSSIFALSTLSWALGAIDVGHRISANELETVDSDEIAGVAPLVSSIVEINYPLADGFLIWRAWTYLESAGLQRRRPLLWISGLACGGAATLMIATIVSRVAFFPTSRLSDVLEATSLGLSVVSALFATSAAASGPSASLFDGGVAILYTLSVMSLFVIRFTPLSSSVILSVYAPINVQISRVSSNGDTPAVPQNRRAPAPASALNSDINSKVGTYDQGRPSAAAHASSHMHRHQRSSQADADLELSASSAQSE
uniref:Uncharacterized protein n=1 Tax=Mycena chlorophos TaxID=658473 RepID=A0ABQ0MAR3_MYCCL|nr:predicted protein [Mycena chlorophos]